MIFKVPEHHMALLPVNGLITPGMTAAVYLVVLASTIIHTDVVTIFPRINCALNSLHIA